MHAASDVRRSGPRGIVARRYIGYAIELATIVVMCYFVAGCPTPAVNEAHYLAKAKHYWNPAWCAGDFFLESADAHEVFYWTFGWLTKYLTLPQTAWVGRFIVWTLFAFSWTSLVRKITSARWAALLSAMLLLTLVHYGHLAGEWLIGGVEAKSFAWPFVFWGIAKALERRWWCVWPLLGIASSFHILVGGWAVVACFLAWLMRRRAERLSWAELALWLCVGGTFALPGLIPAIQLTAQSTSEEIREANLTYTFRRLSHHLVFYRFANWDPRRANFNVVRPLSFATLLVVWWWIAKWQQQNDRHGRLRAIVNASLCIAAMGILLDVALGPFPSTRAGILRFYWFRLSDVLVPVGISVLLTTSLETRDRRRPLLFAAVALAAVGIAAQMPKQGSDARSTALQQQNWRVLDDVDTAEIDDAWRDVCNWIRDETNTPKQSVFLTPVRQQTFKWFAERSDVVTWKDVPQDAAGLNAWWERRQLVYSLGTWPWKDADLCANVCSDLGVTHVVWPTVNDADEPVPSDVQQVYRNDLFRVFTLPTKTPPSSPTE